MAVTLSKLKTKRKVTKQKNVPSFSEAEMEYFLAMVRKALGDKKEPRSTKRRGQVTGGDR